MKTAHSPTNMTLNVPIINAPVILVADDDQINLKILFSYLKDSDEYYKILTATNGKIACDIALAELPDLIIMDWEMPEMNGIEALGVLKKDLRTKDIPVIMATGKMISPENLRQALQAGARDFVRKPIEKIELQARVKTGIELSRSFKTIKQLYDSTLKQHENIIDSINYAKRIQDFILPKISDLKRAFADAFVIYKPKDIISGDFFWFNVKRNKVSIIAADCTGHGVPGAFMSILGTNSTNQIMRDFGALEPDLFLSELNERIGTMLKQGYRKTDGIPPLDGMDLAFCNIDTKECTVSFAGAGRPLYFFHQGEFHSQKGNRYPIGGTALLYDSPTYDKHEFQLAPGDMMYLFSDGITDQFDYENKRKFSNKRFKELLMEIHQLDLQSQESRILRELSNWSGETNQTDDILVIGLRL
jgi:phosphoserine phosphatase RsbU/P